MCHVRELTKLSLEFHFLYVSMSNVMFFFSKAQLGISKSLETKNFALTKLFYYYRVLQYFIFTIFYNYAKV